MFSTELSDPPPSSGRSRVVVGSTPGDVRRMEGEGARFVERPGDILPGEEPGGELRRELGEPTDSAKGAERARSRHVVHGEFRVLAVLCIVVGILLLLENAGFLSGVHRLWPVFPAFVGVGLVLLFFRRGRRDLVLMGAGSYLAGVSILFFVCNYTTWSILSRAWPAFIALVGVSSALAAVYARRGRPMLGVSGGSLVVVAVLLYLILEVNPGLWPISLVLFGLWILLITQALRGSRGGPGEGTHGTNRYDSTIR